MINPDKNLLDDLDSELTAWAHTQYPEQEPDEEQTIEPDGGNEAESYNSYNEMAAAIGYTPQEPQQADLFGDIVKPDNMQTFRDHGYIVVEATEPPAAIIGQDIIAIRALTGKKRKEADEALRAAAVAFLDSASPKCIFISGNTASSKNGKEIGFYFKKNPVTGKNDRIPTLVDSKVTQRYRRATAGAWLQNKVHFLNLTRNLPIPLEVEFTFIRDSLRAFDFINACQVCCDLMKDNGYIPDDDSVHIVPIFNKTVYYHSDMAGVLLRVI